jgi:hypothetical protein
LYLWYNTFGPFTQQDGGGSTVNPVSHGRRAVVAIVPISWVYAFALAGDGAVEIACFTRMPLEVGDVDG